MTTTQITDNISSEAAEWLLKQKSHVGARDFSLLTRSVQTLEGNMLKNAWGGSDYVSALPPTGICPSPATYKGVWNWDSAFHAIAVARWDVAIGREQIQIFLDGQLPSGALPDVLYTDGTKVDTFGKPPVMPWAAVMVNEYAPDLGWIDVNYPKFQAYEAHWMHDRGGDAEGLFFYDAIAPTEELHNQGARFESGWDTSVRWDQPIYNLWAIDLACYMVMLYRAMTTMANLLDKSSDAEQWKAKEAALIERIECTLWDENLGAYCDVDRFTGKSTGVLSPASFMPLYISTASPERASQLAMLAQSAQHFYPAMPTVSYDNPKFDPADYWRGPVWLNVAYFALKGLKDYGYAGVAEKCKETILDYCAMNEDSLYEYYDSRTGQGLGAKQFGWTAAFVIEFILNF